MRSPSAFSLLALLITTSALAQVPQRITYQGRLLKTDGTPEQGAVNITFALYAAPTGGTALWTEQQQLALTNGFYATFLPSKLTSAPPFPANTFDGSERYLELQVAGVALSPRHLVTSVPYALRAGYDPQQVQSRVTGLCAAGNAIRQIAADGTVTCESTAGSGTVSVSATAPLAAAGNVISLAQSSSSVSGYLSSGDFTAFSAKVSSVSAGAGITVTGAATSPTVAANIGTTAGTVAAGNDARLSDARAPTAGSASYIQNQTAASQAASFSISGSATAGALAVNGQTRLGTGGATFGAIKSVNVVWDPPSTASGTTSTFFYTLPEVGAVIGVTVPSTGLACGGGFGGCIYHAVKAWHFNVEATSRYEFDFQNTDSVARDPAPATWTVFYVTP